jgi:hypothetical protein
LCSARSEKNGEGLALERGGGGGYMMEEGWGRVGIMGYKETKKTFFQLQISFETF